MANNSPSWSQYQGMLYVVLVLVDRVSANLLLINLFHELRPFSKSWAGLYCRRKKDYLSPTHAGSPDWTDRIYSGPEEIVENRKGKST
jgi:hypothetical protein